MSVMLKGVDLIAEEFGGRGLCISLWLISLPTVPGTGDHSAWTSAPPSTLEVHYIYCIALVTPCHCVYLSVSFTKGETP